jgi:hypothetical protein
MLTHTVTYARLTYAEVYGQVEGERLTAGDPCRHLEALSADVC